MRRALVILLFVLVFPAVAHASAQDIPVPVGAPWPEMRHDRHNTGASDIVGRWVRGRRPWSFTTGKGIFSTPTVGPGNVVYVGSGDGVFHALSPRGRSLWSFRTGGVIDSSAVLGRDGITIGSGDEFLYHLRTAAKLRRHRSRVIWKLKAQQPSGTSQLVDWWEGNAELGPDGTIYAGNTGSAAYAVHPDGKVKWIYRGGNSFWTTAAIADDGTTFWGSLDLFVYALDKDGKQLWRTPTLGFIISSPALSHDGSTIYIGSFDGQLHALDAKTGTQKWSFQTGDHIYSSPALDEDASGNLRAIYFASADGSVYALRPDGTKLWQYDTGDAVRSSPVIGDAPGGGKIVYVGSANGTLYALNAADGTRRWSFDTTPNDRVLRDRNDLNASPALGTNGVYIGSESGRLWFVPYDWCLHARDRRCSTDPGEAFGPDLTRVFPVTFGGTTAPSGYPGSLPAAATLIGRLVVHRARQTVDASMQPVPDSKSLVSANPPFDFSAALSGDGHFMFVEPTGILDPDRDYTLRFSGVYTEGGLHLGNEVVAGTMVTQFGDTFRFHTEPSLGPLPLHTSPAAVSAFRIRRLAVPLPAFLPSVNQIGFDSYEWLAGVLNVGAPGADGRGSLLAWVIGIKRDARGRMVPDPKSGFAFPLAGSYLRDFFALGLQNMPLTFSFGTVPLDVLNFRGRMGRNMVTDGPNLYAEATCAKVPNYGPFLGVTRLCNDQGKIIASGAYLTQGYDKRGTANRKPRGLSVTGVHLDAPTASSDGQAVATLAVARGTHYPAAAHTVSILLLDASTGQPVPLDYGHTTTVTADGAGNAQSVTLKIPAGTTMPGHVRAYVIADVFPLATADF